jgi:hypothetical protein
MPAGICCHFNGTGSKVCKAGINYEELVNSDQLNWDRRMLPCIASEALPSAVKCAKRTETAPKLTPGTPEHQVAREKYESELLNDMLAFHADMQILPETSGQAHAAKGADPMEQERGIIPDQSAPQYLDYLVRLQMIGTGKPTWVQKRRCKLCGKTITLQSTTGQDMRIQCETEGCVGHTKDKDGKAVVCGW